MLKPNDIIHFSFHLCYWHIQTITS